MKKLVFTVVSAAASFFAFAAVPFEIGIAGFTFSKQTLDKALSTMEKIDCHYLCHKDFFLGYEASEAEIESFKAKLASAKVKCVATGPFYANSEEQLLRQFEFARKMGIKVIVGVPYEVKDKKKDSWGPNRVESDKMLDVIDKLVKEYDICYAIHNHGPDLPNLFPTGESVLKRIASRDKRIGVCFDIGHERRSGKDPVAFIIQNGDRIFDVHIKNIIVDKKKNIAMEAPRGELDIPAVFRALKKVGYKGVCHIEYEKDFKDNAMPLAESFGYFRGVADGIE